MQGYILSDVNHWEKSDLLFFMGQFMLFIFSIFEYVITLLNNDYGKNWTQI